MLNLIRDLCGLRGISGDEGRVRAYLERQLEGFDASHDDAAAIEEAREAMQRLELQVESRAEASDRAAAGSGAAAFWAGAVSEAAALEGAPAAESFERSAFKDSTTSPIASSASQVSDRLYRPEAYSRRTPDVSCSGSMTLPVSIFLMKEGIKIKDTTKSATSATRTM